jgi:putative membrane protein
MKLQILALCAAIMMPFAAAADTTKNTKDTAKLDTNELQVLAHEHSVNQMEIDAGKLAQKQGATQAVKSYGQMLVKDHTQSDRDITAFAKKHGQTIPAEKMTTDAEKKQMKDNMDAMNRLKNMKGADFDREFLNTMATGHDTELAKIDTFVGEVKNTELATMLKDMKPVLQKHADQARDLSKNNAQASLK